MDNNNRRFIATALGEEGSVAAIVQRMAVLRSDKRIDYFCVVEGKSDKLFYQHALNIKLRTSGVKYLYKENNGGKFEVVKSYKIFKKLFPREMRKCIFIVDHDYDGLNLTKYKLERPDLEHITVLPCYSFENYFLMGNNVSIIFSCLQMDLGGAMPAYERTWREFTRHIVDYCALKMTTVLKGMMYTRRYRDEEMFRYEHGEYINEKKLHKEMENLRAELRNEKDADAMIAKCRATLLKNPHYMKGKILFAFLCNYMDAKHDIDITADHNYTRIASQIEMKMDIKYGSL